MRDGVVGCVLFEQGVAEVTFGGGVVGLEFGSLGEVGDGIVKIAIVSAGLAGEGEAEIVVGVRVSGVGLDARRYSAMASSAWPWVAYADPRLLRASAKPGFGLDGPLKLLDGFRQFVLLKEEAAEVVVGVSVAGVDFKRGVELDDGVGGLACGGEQDAEIVVRLSELRLLIGAAWNCASASSRWPDLARVSPKPL